MSQDKNDTADYWINHLDLEPHPEGGYYKEIFRSKHEVFRAAGDTKRAALTSIYYLLESSDFSGFHRLKSDELWYFHKGEPIFIHVIDEGGAYEYIELSDSTSGNLQAVVEANCWFAAEIPSKSSFSLVSCAVAPGFDFAEFEMAKKQFLLEEFPRHEAIINKWSRF
jgi:predicted cupin superfamily sugar epimerase